MEGKDALSHFEHGEEPFHASAGLAPAGPDAIYSIDALIEEFGVGHGWTLEEWRHRPGSNPVSIASECANSCLPLQHSRLSASSPRSAPASNESPANLRHSSDETALNELAESIRTQGLLSPLLVRPKSHRYEIAAGARRYRAAQFAGLDSVPVRIMELADAQALETSIVENLQRRNVHPLDEATGYVSLLHLDYTAEQIAAKCGKPPAYVAA